MEQCMALGKFISALDIHFLAQLSIACTVTVLHKKQNKNVKPLTCQSSILKIIESKYYLPQQPITIFRQKMPTLFGYATITFMYIQKYFNEWFSQNYIL
jgi:hypothetical protein